MRTKCRGLVLAIAMLATLGGHSIAHAQAPGQVEPAAQDQEQPPPAQLPPPSYEQTPAPPRYTPPTEPQRYEAQPQPYYPPPPPRYYEPRRIYTPMYVQTEQEPPRPPPPFPVVFGVVGAIMHSPSSGPSGMMLEGGVRPGPSPVWLHGAIEQGQYSLGGGAGDMWELRAGLEWRACSALKHACLITGADLGYMEADILGMTDSGTAFVPRIGIDTGGRYIRFRAELQLPVTSGMREYDTSYDYYYDSGPTVIDGEHTRLGVATSFAIAAQY